jgi:hypothetical protein
VAMQKEDKDRLAEKLAELGRHAERQKELTAEAQIMTDYVVERYLWVAQKLASAQTHHGNAMLDIAASQAGPPKT